jgi:hypothetical protein
MILPFEVRIGSKAKGAFSIRGQTPNIGIQKDIYEVFQSKEPSVRRLVEALKPRDV